MCVRKEYRASQCCVSDAVRLAKEKWICDLATKAEDAVRNGRVQWGCIKTLASTFAGRQSAPTTSIVDENDNALTLQTQIAARWQRHFDTVFNVATNFDAEVIGRVPQSEVRDDLDTPPTLGELQTALKRMKCGKAGGSIGVLPEMI